MKNKKRDKKIFDNMKQEVPYKQKLNKEKNLKSVNHELFFGIVIIIILTSLNLYLYINKGGVSYSTFSGKVSSEIPKLTARIDLSTILFLIQWVLVILIALVIYHSHLKNRKEKIVKIDKIKMTKGKSQTDLDVFYNILKNEKILKMSAVAKTFNLTKEKALEWSKILENYGLANVEYPAFDDPVVRINENEKNEEHF